MQAFLTLTRRELGAYFLSMTGYIILAASMFLLGLSFVDLLVSLQHDPTPMPMTEVFYLTPFFWLILLLAAPVITMRLFALEKFSGTFETLMTAPVSDLQVVLSKFAAAMVFFLLSWLPLLACLFVIRYYTSDHSSWDAGVLCSTFLGILLLGAMFISIGCFASALTRSQVSAAMMGLVFGAALFLLSVIAEQFHGRGAGWQAETLSFFMLIEQMHDFSRGVVDSRPIVFALSMTLLFLFLTLRIVESRRWK